MIDLLKIRTYTGKIISILLKLRDNQFKLVEDKVFPKLILTVMGLR